VDACERGHDDTTTSDGNGDPGGDGTVTGYSELGFDRSESSHVALLYVSHITVRARSQSFPFLRPCWAPQFVALSLLRS